MAEQIPRAAERAAEKPTTVTPSGGFAPQINTHPVTTLTLGSKNFNDSDKSNYFEG